MNKVDLVKAVKENVQAQVENKITNKDAEMFVNAVFEEIKKSLVAHEGVSIPKFGTFDTPERAERNGVNPSTGESIVIPASYAVKFKASSTLKKEVKEA